MHMNPYDIYFNRLYTVSKKGSSLVKEREAKDGLAKTIPLFSLTICVAVLDFLNILFGPQKVFQYMNVVNALGSLFLIMGFNAWYFIHKKKYVEIGQEFLKYSENKRYMYTFFSWFFYILVYVLMVVCS